uniref:CaMBD domain-containing protein n=2 Tax=Caenorhabditis japonica TaxID=281687 RepID=A0A8R1DIE6_CAEJA
MNRETFSRGPTIASAPSVEQEDYRTPRPSFDNGGYAGKSFDFSNGHSLGFTASESNGLVKLFRVRITDRSLYLALFGVILMLVDSELTAEKVHGVSKDHWLSMSLRICVTCSTVALLYHIILYHLNDIVLELVDCGADDWRVVVTTERIVQFIVEFICCAVCPIPGSGKITWTYIEPSLHKDGSSEERKIQTRHVDVPIDIILSCFMLCRAYLFARFMVLHSKQFQDASTRTLAALNRIQVNFSFVIKTSLDQQPVLFLTSFTFIFWIIMSWMFVQCERYGFSGENPQSIIYSNSLWFIAITFMLNGYGDIVPQTNAGRIIAIFVGVVGAITSSILIAVISRNILLSQGQRNVNNFMYDSKLSREHKEAAARVLQHTWHIHKCLQGGEGGNRRLRTYQRKFLRAIHKFRSVKSEMREFSENNNQNNHQVNRLVTDMHTSMQRLINVQEEMRMQIEVLQQSVRNHYHHSNSSNVPQLQGTGSS